MKALNTKEKALMAKPLDTLDDVYHRALSLVAKREYNSHTLSVKLSQVGAPPAHIDEVIQQFLEKRWIDESRYCELFMRAQLNKGHGLMRIKQDAQQKGIAQDVLNKALGTLEIDWFQLAREAYNKRFLNKPVADIKDKQKRIRYLQYRGFSMEETLSAMQESDEGYYE